MAQTTEAPLCVGIAGLGRSGWSIHALGLGAMAEKYRIVAVMDAKPERREEAAARFQCRTYTDFDSLLGEKAVELVVVATPSHLHAEHSIRALETGRHVVCEKPMASSVAEADQMIEASRGAGKTLAVFQNRRYTADFLKLQEVIGSGRLGRIVMIRVIVHSFGRRWDWQTLRKFGGGTLYNTCPHFVDQALALLPLDGPEPEVFCHLDQALSSGDADDHCKIILRTPGQPLIDIEVTAAGAYPQEFWQVLGTRGGLTGSMTKLRWKYADLEGVPERPVDTEPTPDRSYNAEQLSWHEESWEAPPDPAPCAGGTPVIRFYEDLHQTIRRGAPLVVTLESVRRQMKVLQHCRDWYSEGRHR